MLAKTCGAKCFRAWRSLPALHVALARKMLTVAYGVMKSGVPYDPKRLEAYPVLPPSGSAGRRYVLKG